MVTIARKAEFNAAHRLYRADWTEEKNRQVFGKCSHPNYHGHNYTLIVKVTGELDQETGCVMDLKRLKDLIGEEVVERYDHKNLNLDVPDFEDRNPTAENIVVLIWERLRANIPAHLSLKTVLYETERNFVEYSGG